MVEDVVEDEGEEREVEEVEEEEEDREETPTIQDDEDSKEVEDMVEGVVYQPREVVEVAIEIVVE